MDCRRNKNHERKTYASFDGLSRLELFLGVLEANVGVVHGPDDAIDVSGNVEENGRVGESLDSGLKQIR